MTTLNDLLTSNEAIIAYTSLGAGMLHAVYDKIRHNKKNHDIWPIILTSVYGGFMTGQETRAMADTFKGVGISAAFFELGYHCSYNFLEKIVKHKSLI